MFKDSTGVAKVTVTLSLLTVTVTPSLVSIELFKAVAYSLLLLQLNTIFSIKPSESAIIRIEPL